MLVIAIGKLVRAQKLPSNDCHSSARTRDAKVRQAAKIAELCRALIDNGSSTLPAQAVALGLSRSTTWQLLRSKNTGSGLSASIAKRILSSPNLPTAARDWVHEYIAEKLLGAYGHDRTQLNRFRRRLGYPEHPAKNAKEGVEDSD